VFFVIGLALVQYATPNLPDNDGFYHIKFAWLMRTEGLKPDFNWLPLSILNAEDYYDHHFLYHILLIPFTFGDLVTGAKWAAIIIPALSFLAVWFFLDQSRVPLAWVWAAALLGASEAFLFRMSIPRAQALSVGLLALGMLWINQEKIWHLLALGFLFVWSYNAFPLLAVLAGLYALASLITDRSFRWKPLAFVLLGIALGLVINPYFPQNILFTINHILPKLTQPEVSGLGNEWFPYTTAQVLENAFPALLLFASATLGIGLSGKKIDKFTLFALLTALLFALMFFQARRFVEYFPPFALILAAFAWSPLIGNLLNSSKQASSRHPFHHRTWGVVAMILLVILSSAFSIMRAGNIMRTAKPADLYADGARWLQDNTPAGSLVFHTDWDDFPRLFFYNSHNVYLAGLDPTYFQLYDEHLYNLWVKITRGDVQNLSASILENFDTRFVHTDLKHSDFLDVAGSDPDMVEVFRDDQNVIFKIITEP